MIQAYRLPSGNLLVPYTQHLRAGIVEGYRLAAPTSPEFKRWERWAVATVPAWARAIARRLEYKRP